MYIFMYIYIYIYIFIYIYNTHTHQHLFIHICAGSAVSIFEISVGDCSRMHHTNTQMKDASYDGDSLTPQSFSHDCGVRIFLTLVWKSQRWVKVSIDRSKYAKATLAWSFSRPGRYGEWVLERRREWASLRSSSATAPASITHTIRWRFRGCQKSKSFTQRFQSELPPTAARRGYGVFSIWEQILERNVQRFRGGIT